jgi:hypothetical protein
LEKIQTQNFIYAQRKRSSNKPREALDTFLATHHILSSLLPYKFVDLSISHREIEGGRQERGRQRDAVAQENCSYA